MRRIAADLRMEGGSNVIDQLLSIEDKMADPDRYAATLKRLREHPEEASVDEFDLRDKSRVFIGYTAPMRGEGGLIGRIWTLREVTQETRARPAEGRVRRDGFPRAANAAHVDDGLSGDVAGGRSRQAAAGTGALPLDRVPELGTASAARRRPAVHRTSRRKRPAAPAGGCCSARRNRRRGSRGGECGRALARGAVAGRVERTCCDSR